jgi:hypothetical protein
MQENNAEFCCAEFSAHATETGNKTPQFEYWDERGVWCINGCCGGGCYVVDSMRHCPFCGTKLKEPNGKP